MQLQKQGLLEKKYTGFKEVCQDALGLHSTDYWTPYLSVWARIGDYDAEKVFTSINSGNGYVRRPAFRNTHHVISIENLGVILRALGPQLERSMRAAPPIKDLTEDQMEKRIREIIHVLSEGPHSITDLKKKLPHIGDQMRWLILIANARGIILRTSGSHAKSTRLDYDLTSNWLPEFKPPDISEEDALREIVLRYIALFGPVTIKDLAWWIPLKVTPAKELVSDLDDSISKIKIGKKEHLIVPSDLESVNNLDERTEPIVFLLPYEDHFPKAYSEREWYLDSECKDVIFPRNREYFWPPKMEPPPSGQATGMNASGEIRPSIWVDGKIVGRWEIEVEGKTAKVHTGLVHKVSQDSNNLIERKCVELEEFLINRLIPIS